MSTRISRRNKIKMGAELSKFIESSFPVDVKACEGEWRYTESNELAASVSGLSSEDRIGMNIYDIAKINRIPDAAVEKIVHADRSVEVDKAPVTLIHAFLDKPEGLIVVDKVVKQAVVDQKDKMIGVLSYAQDLVPYIHRIDLYSFYKHYYSEKEAVQKLLTHMNVKDFFTQMPTDQELFFLLHDPQKTGQLSQELKLSVDEVRSYQDRIQDKLIMIDYDDLVQRLQVQEAISAGE